MSTDTRPFDNHPTIEDDNEQEMLKRHQEAIDAWNKQHKVGTRVYLTRRSDGSKVEAVTVSEAEMYEGRRPVVWLKWVEGIIGAFPLEQIIVTRPFDPAAFGFEKLTKEGAAFEAWGQPYYTLYIFDAATMSVEYRDEMRERHSVYEGFRPDSHEFAVNLFRHLGLPIEGVK